MAEKDFEADDLELKDYAFEPKTYTVNDVQITDYTGIEHDKIFLVNKKDILTKPRPSWIPELDENCLEREDFLPHCVKDSDGYYFVQKTSLEVPEDYNGPKLSDYEKRQKFTKKTYYKMSLDLIAATCDYYIKKRRAEIKLSGDTHRVGFPRSAGSMTWARYDDMVSMFSLCEAYKDDPEITKNYGHIKARRSNPKHKGYIRQTEIAFHDHYGPLLQELKDKKLDMNLQKQDAADTHKKGEETSYGMSGRSDTLKKDYGVTIKKQNGTGFDSQQLKNISEALENVWNHYGKLDDVAIAFNLGISYAANTLQHARKAVGIFHPEYHAIGVSFFEEKVADSKDSSMVLCHEVAHWLDFEKGNRDHFHYASDKSGTLENKIALKFKELVRKRNSGGKKLGDYWYRTCECLARAMEEDYGLKHNCYDFYNDQAYLTPEVFKKEIAPLVEQLLEENRKYFNLVKKENLSQELSTAKDLSFFDINENTLRKLIKSYTSSAASLAETEKSKPDTFNYLRGANKAMDNKINRYQEKIVKLQTKVDVLNMLVQLETKQAFGQFEMKTLEADICPVDRDDILRMDKNTFEYYAAVINSALKNAGFSEKKSIPLVLKNPSGYTFNTLNILEDGNIEVVSGSVNSLSEDEFKAIEEKNLGLQKKIFDEVKKNIENNSLQQPEHKNILPSLSSDDSFVSDFRSGKFNSIFDRLSDLNFKDDFISSGSLYSKSRIEGINNLWLELFRDGVPPAVIKFENEWEKKIDDGNFNAPSFKENWIEEASKAENEKLLSYFSKMSVPDENVISEHNGHLFRTMIINAIAKQSRFLTEYTDPFSNIVLYQKPECLLEKRLRYEIIENEIKKRGLKIMQDKEIENNKETSEKKTRWFSVHYKQIAEDRAEFLDHIHKNQEIENLDIHKTLLENHLEIQGCILGGTGMIDSAYESFVCSGADGFKYLLTPHNSEYYKTENRIIVSDKIFDTFEDAVKACIEEEIKVYKPEITDYKIAEDSGYFFRMPEKYRDFILDYILENKKDIVTEAEDYAAKNNISEKSQKEKLRHYIGISMEGYNKYRFDNPEWSKIIDDHVKQIENPLFHQNEKTDPEAAEKKSGKTKYKANDQKYISKFLDKDGITIDFERWTKKDNPTSILGNNYELSLQFPVTKNCLDCFARFVIDETEPDGTFIKNHVDFTSEEYINSISSYYNERNEHYPDQDEFDAIRWKYITDGQKLVRLGFTKIRDIDSDITDALIKTGRENFKDELSFYKNSSRQNCRVFKLDDNAGNPLYIIHNFETQQYSVLQDVNPENPGVTYFHAEGYPELDGLLLHLGERTNLSAEESKKLKYFECPSLNIKFTPELLLEKKALDYDTIDYYKNNSGFEMSFYNKLKEAVSPQKNNDFSIDYSEEKPEPVQQDLFEISENNKEYWITDKDGNRITNSDAKKIIKDNLDLLNRLSEEKTPAANSKMVTASYISDYLLERLNKEDAQEVKNFTESFYDNIRNDYLSSLSDERIAILLGKGSGSGFSFNESEAKFFRKNLEKKLVGNDYFIGTLQTVINDFSKEWSDTLERENPHLISLLKKACDESVDYESRLYTAYHSYRYKHDPDDVAGYSLETFKDKIVNDRTLMEKYLSAYPEFEKLHNEYIEHNKISDKANLVSIFKEHNRNIKITEKQLSGRIYNSADTNPEVLAIYYDDVKNEQSGLLLSESMAAIIASHQGEPFATWLENISSDVRKVYPEITDRYIRKAIEPLKLGFGHGRKMHTLILQDHNYDIEQNMTKSNISKETNMTETTKPHSFFIKDTAEFDAFADFEPITNLTAKQAVKKYAELRKDGYSCGIGMHIPGDFIFDDPDGNGITLVVNHEGTAVFDIYGDTFIDQLQEKDIENGRARLYIDLYKELYNAFESEGILVKKPQFVFDKESELFVEKEYEYYINNFWYSENIDELLSDAKKQLNEGKIKAAEEIIAKRNYFENTFAKDLTPEQKDIILRGLWEGEDKGLMAQYRKDYPGVNPPSHPGDRYIELYLAMHLDEYDEEVLKNFALENEIENVISTDNIHLNNEHGENGWHSMDMFVADEKYIKAAAISDERFAMPVASWKDGEPEITVSMVTLLISDPENHDKQYLDVSSEGKPSISSDEKWNLIREQKTFDILGEQIKNLFHKGISFYEWAKKDPEDSRSLEYIICNKDSKAYFDDSQTISNNLMNFLRNSEFVNADYSDDKITVTLNFDDESFEMCQNELVKLDIDWGLEHRIHQVITYSRDTLDDDKQAFVSLEEAQAAAKDYLSNDYYKDENGKPYYDGVCVLNNKTKEIEFTQGVFPSKEIFSLDVLDKNNFELTPNEISNKIENIYGYFFEYESNENTVDIYQYEKNENGSINKDGPQNFIGSLDSEGNFGFTDDYTEKLPDAVGQAAAMYFREITKSVSAEIELDPEDEEISASATDEINKDLIKAEREVFQKKILQLKEELKNIENDRYQDATDKEIQDQVNQINEYIEKYENITDADIKNIILWRRNNFEENQNNAREVEANRNTKQINDSSLNEGELFSYNDLHPYFTLKNRNTGRETVIQPKGRDVENIKDFARLSSLTEAEKLIEAIKSKGFGIYTTYQRAVIFNDELYYDFDEFARADNRDKNIHLLGQEDFIKYINDFKISKNMKLFLENKKPEKKEYTLSDFDSEIFWEKYRSNYDKYYNSEDPEVRSEEMANSKYFDELSYTNSMFNKTIGKLAQERGDYFSSDREAAAVVKAFFEMGVKLEVTHKDISENYILEYESENERVKLFDKNHVYIGSFGSQMNSSGSIYFGFLSKNNETEPDYIPVEGISNEETDKLFEKAKAIFMENGIDVNNFEQNFIDEMNNIDPDDSYYELFRDKVTGKLITEELNQMGFVKDPDGNYVLDDIKVSLSLVFNNKENPALIISHISDPAVMQTIHLNDSYAKKHSLGMAFEDLLESGWLKETKNPNLKSFIDGKMLERDFIGKYIPDADNNEAVTLLDDITAYEEGFSDVLKSFKDFKDAWDISVSSEQEVSDFGGKLQKALYNAAEAIKDKKAYSDSLLRYAEKYKPGMEDPDNVYGKFKFHEDELKVFLKVNMINASIYNISMDKNRDGTQIIFALMSSKDKRHYGYITADFDDPANCKYNFTDLKNHNLDISLTENISKMRDFCEKGKPFYEASENHSVNIELTSDGSKLSLTFNEVPDIDLRSSLNWAGFKYSTIAKAWKADFNQENSDKLLATVKKYWPDDYEHAVKQMEGIGTKTAAEHKKESISVDFSQIENTSEKLAENIKFINEKYPEYKGNLTHILTDIMFNATSKNRNEILDKFRDCNNKDELNSKLKKMVYGSFETEIKKQQNVKPKKDPEEGFSR